MYVDHTCEMFSLVNKKNNCINIKAGSQFNFLVRVRTLQKEVRGDFLLLCSQLCVWPPPIAPYKILRLACNLLENQFSRLSLRADWFSFFVRVRSAGSRGRKLKLTNFAPRALAEGKNVRSVRTRTKKFNCEPAKRHFYCSEKDGKLFETSTGTRNQRSR